MKRQKRVWDKKTGGLIYVDSVKDFLAQQSEDKVEAQLKRKKKLLKKKKKSLKKLTKRQTDTLKKHSVHHTAKHMSFMRSEMKKGKTFSTAHKAAMKKVGR